MHHAKISACMMSRSTAQETFEEISSLYEGKAYNMDCLELSNFGWRPTLDNVAHTNPVSEMRGQILIKTIDRGGE